MRSLLLLLIVLAVAAVRADYVVTGTAFASSTNCSASAVNATIAGCAPIGTGSLAITCTAADAYTIVTYSDDECATPIGTLSDGVVGDTCRTLNGTSFRVTACTAAPALSSASTTAAVPAAAMLAALALLLASVL